MGFVAIQIYMICAALLLLLLLLLHSPSSSALVSSTAAASPSPTPLPSHHEMQPQTPSAAPTTAQYQVFYIKNTTPFPLDKNQEPVKKHGKMRRHKKRSNKAKNFKTTAPFSVMLPKGFIPPSGSSPCHNDFPNSVAFFCQLSPTAVKP